MTKLASKFISVVGILEKIIYTSEQTNYTVAKLRREEDDLRITIVGTIMGANEGEKIKTRGIIESHPKYGEQFKVEDFEVILPTEEDAIEKYLSSGLIKGIGASMASRLVKHFSDKTLEIMEKDPNRLLEVSGIGAKKLRMIFESWQAQRESYQVMLFLAKYNIRGALASKIYRQYGGNSVSMLKEHPYRLAIDIDGVGFLTADNIAKNMGITADDPERIHAAIFHCLREAAARQGHCYLPQEELIKRVEKILFIGQENKIIEILDKIVSQKFCQRINTADESVYMKYLYAAEYYTAGYLKKCLQTPMNRGLRKIETHIAEVEREMGIQFLPDQNKAIRRALEKKVCILTGGPGVGKTTIIKTLVKILEQKHCVALAAPTGRAAKRMSETSGYSAGTIHRLLHYNPHTKTFEHDEENPLKTDHIIIDETSMLDIRLACHLLKVIPAESSITFVGDIDQLPSVGPGNFLKDMINSGMIDVVRLEHIFRQSQGSSIVSVAHQINQGHIPKIPTEPPADILFVPVENPEQGATEIVDMVSRILPKRHNYNAMTEIQVLTPMYRGDIGADNLNKLLAQTLNAHGKSIVRDRFRIGDKVMQTSNDYIKDVYNGDIGIIVSHDSEEKIVTINFDNRNIEYQESELDELTRAYAISIHKSQGSEYPAVVIPLFTQHAIMLQRNLLYTAVTRGKSNVIIIGNYRALSMAVRTLRAGNRYTNFDNILQS